MYVPGYNKSLDFSNGQLVNDEVKVGSFIRGGKRIRSFFRKDKISRIGGFEDLDNITVEEGNIGAALGAKDLLNPAKAIKEGFARETMMLKKFSEIAGQPIERKDVIRATMLEKRDMLKGKLKDPESRKEIVLGVTGFLGDKAGGLTGVPFGGAATGFIATQTVKKGYGDTDVLKKALGALQRDDKYNEASRISKLGRIFNESKKIKEAQRSATNLEATGDVASLIGGNLVSELSPIKNPLVGMLGEEISGKLAKSYKKMVPPKNMQQATAILVAEQLKKKNKKEPDLSNLTKYLK